MKKHHRISLQQKLILTFLLTSSLIFLVNLFLFLNINRAITKIDEVYISNVQISSLSDSLSDVQTYMTDYLSTKSTESLQNYYGAEDNYASLLSQLESTATTDHVRMMMKNIHSLSDSYFSTAEDTLTAKRGRNIQKYKASYDDASSLYSYLDTYIYSLNSVQFRNNTVNYSALRTSFRPLELITFLLLAAVTATNLAISLLLTKSITDPLSRLASNANRISSGSFDVPELEVRRDDEIGVVATAFNEMVVSIRGYIEKLRTSMELESRLKENELRMDAHLKEAELKYLQAQINPHFLFNTLNAGAQLAMMENADTTYRYLQNVASFFRTKTNREKQVTSLSDEIALVDNYIYIINVRFSGDINYEKSIDEDLVNVSVPSMILQPIIENAINHGVRDISWPAKITLSVYRTGENITVSVRDNGKGMTEEQIAALLAGRAPVRAKGDETNGVGLGNVVSRLQLFYHREDGFDITSAGENKGTEVLLYLPMPD